MRRARNKTTPAADGPAPTFRVPKAVWFILAATVIAIVAVILWPPPKGDPNAIVPPQELASDDPRLTYNTPYRNVRPDVKYVGDQACADCHDEIHQTYRQHPMGRTLLPIAETQSADNAIEKLDARHKNPFKHTGLEYQVAAEDGAIRHSELRRDEEGVISKIEVPIEFAIGSGNHARSYLFQRDGAWFYSPITWYTRTQSWGISPAFTRDNRHFTLAAGHACLFCHGNQLRHEANTVNRYQIVGHSIGCERCHGPGELHVQRHQKGEAPSGQLSTGKSAAAPFDDTIVNPSKLEPMLRDSVCQQCHLEGFARVARRGRDLFDYRPGLPLHLFRTTLVRQYERDVTEFVGHVEEMHQSQCFQKSQGKLACISCHDPHRQPAPQERDEHFRKSCLACHSDHGCSLPEDQRRQRSPADSCIQCHMPERDATKINHVAVSDHRILRNPDAPRLEAGHTVSSSTFLTDFHAALQAGDDPEPARALGMALVDLAASSAEPKRTQSLEQAVPLLQAAVKRHDGDVPAWEALGRAMQGLKRYDEADTAYGTAIQIAPDRETALVYSGSLTVEREQYNYAVPLYAHLVKVNPTLFVAHVGLGNASRELGDMASARTAYERALALHPASVDARMGLGLVFLQQKEIEAAKEQFLKVTRLQPDYWPADVALGDVYFSRQQWAPALVSYRKALQSQPDNVQMRERVKVCLEKLGIAEG